MRKPRFYDLKSMSSSPGDGHSNTAWFGPSLKETKEEAESKTCCMDTTRVEMQLNFCHRCLLGPRRREGSFCQTVETTTNHQSGNAPVNTRLRPITVCSGADWLSCPRNSPYKHTSHRLGPESLFPLSTPPTGWGFNHAADSGPSRLLCSSSSPFLCIQHMYSPPLGGQKEKPLSACQRSK